MVAARRLKRDADSGHVDRSEDHEFPNNGPDAVEQELQLDEWLRDSDAIDEASLFDTLRWKIGAKPGTRKHHDGFGRSSKFARKAQMKKMQVNQAKAMH
jgi:hypothetical protein